MTCLGKDTGWKSPSDVIILGESLVKWDLTTSRYKAIVFSNTSAELYFPTHIRALDPCRKASVRVTYDNKQPKSYLRLSLNAEKAMAPHSGTFAWKLPWMEEPGRLQSMGLLRVGHDWATSLSLFTFMHWRRKWQPTPVFLPGESQGRGSLVASVYGVTQSRTRLKWLSIA